MKNTQELAIKHYGLSEDEASYDGAGCLRAEAAIKRGVYKYTSCGAWVEFTQTGLVLGSIIEGVEQCTESHTLNYPFTDEAYWAALEAIEKEAQEIWNATHGCEDCGPEDEYNDGHIAINPHCKTCEGEGAII